jgi:glycosyltransferase involved in cell wall biosynthesis
MNQPLVSIVMPTYQRGEQAAIAIGKLWKEQTYRNLEFIVSDDGSTDDTILYLLRLKAETPELGQRLRILHSKHNQGASSARNAGLAAAKGDYLVLFDDDDVKAPSAIELQIKKAQNLPPDQNHLTVITSDYNIRPFEDPEKIDVVRTQDIPTPEAAFQSPPALHVTWLIPRRVYEHICSREPNGEFYATKVRVGEDNDLYFGMLESGVTFTTVPEPLYTYNAPHKGKYTFDAKSNPERFRAFGTSAALVLQKHHALLASLPDELYLRQMQWYQENMPPDLFENTLRNLGVDLRSVQAVRAGNFNPAAQKTSATAGD